MTTKTYRQVLSAGTLKGDDVVNAEGKKLGKIEEIMIDVEAGIVAYVVLSFGGFLSLGDKLFAIPWGAFSLDETNKRFVLNVNKETLEKAKGFDKNHWPDVADPDWRAQTYSHYDIEPYWE